MSHDVEPTHILAAASGPAAVVLAILAGAFALSWAEAFVVPLLLGILGAYALNSPVTWLEALRVPRALGALMVMTVVVGAIAFGAYSLRGQMQTIIEQLPRAASRFTVGIERAQHSQVGNLRKIEKAAATVETATHPVSDGPTVRRQPPTHVIVDQPAFRVGNYLWKNSRGALAAAGQVTMTVFLIYFLLLGADTFKRKFVRLAGPGLTRRKRTVRMLGEINDSV